MKQTNNFNFEKFKNGGNATTKLGNPVKFITMCSDGRMLVQVTPRSRIVEQNTLKHVVPAMPYTDKYHVTGKKYPNTDSEFDIVMG